MSTNHLRTGLEQLKEFYLKKLLCTSLHTEQVLCSYTISELEELDKKIIFTKKTPKKISQAK